MSFDPLTAVWAANKAAEMVGGSGSSSGGVLPVVEMSTMLTESNIFLSDEDSEKITEANSKGCPIMVKAKVACANESVDGGYEYYNLSLVMSRTAYLDADGIEVPRVTGFYFVGQLDTAYNLEMRIHTINGTRWRGYAKMTRIGL